MGLHVTVSLSRNLEPYTNQDRPHSAVLHHSFPLLI